MGLYTTPLGSDSATMQESWNTILSPAERKRIEAQARKAREDQERARQKATEAIQKQLDRIQQITVKADAAERKLRAYQGINGTLPMDPRDVATPADAARERMTQAAPWQPQNLADVAFLPGTQQAIADAEAARAETKEHTRTRQKLAAAPVGAGTDLVDAHTPSAGDAVTKEGKAAERAARLRAQIEAQAAKAREALDAAATGEFVETPGPMRAVGLSPEQIAAADRKPSDEKVTENKNTRAAKLAARALEVSQRGLAKGRGTDVAGLEAQQAAKKAWDVAQRQAEADLAAYNDSIARINDGTATPAHYIIAAKGNPAAGQVEPGYAQSQALAAMLSSARAQPFGATELDFADRKFGDASRYPLGNGAGAPPPPQQPNILGIGPPPPPPPPGPGDATWSAGGATFTEPDAVVAASQGQNIMFRRKASDKPPSYAALDVVQKAGAQNPEAALDALYADTGSEAVAIDTYRRMFPGNEDAIYRWAERVYHGSQVQAREALRSGVKPPLGAAPMPGSAGRRPSAMAGMGMFGG